MCDIYLTKGDIDLGIDFTYRGGCPAIIDRLPEDCEPEIYAEVEIENVYIDIGAGVFSKCVYELLSNETIEYIDNYILENYEPEEPEPPEPEY